MSQPLRVLIVDDHPVFRDGLRLALGTAGDMEIVAEADTATAALELADELTPDVVVMDLHLPDRHGAEATRTILERRPGTAVLVLTMSDDDAALLTALRSGARGYIVKGADQAAIIAAVRAVARGEATFGAGVSDRVLTLLASDRTAPMPLPELTDRERHILGLIEHGLTNQAIAERLYLSPKTVRILTKLHVINRSEAARRAREAGLHLRPGSTAP
jgi:DNA-binding NarL/FixJ family response regulator